MTTLQTSGESALADSKTTLAAGIAVDSAICKSEWDKLRNVREQESLRMQSILDSLLSATLEELTNKAILTSTIQSLSDKMVATSRTTLSQATAGFSSALQTSNANISTGLDQRLIDSRTAIDLAKEVAVRDISTALTTALDTFTIESSSSSTQPKRKKRLRIRGRTSGTGSNGDDDDDGSSAVSHSQHSIPSLGIPARDEDNRNGNNAWQSGQEWKWISEWRR